MIFVISLFGTMWFAAGAIFWTKVVLGHKHPDGEDWFLGAFWSVAVTVILGIAGVGVYALYDNGYIFRILAILGGIMIGLFVVIFPTIKYQTRPR